MAVLTEIDAVTERYFVPLLVDNIFKSNVLFVYLWRKRKKADGGTEIVQPVILTAPTAATSYSGADTLPLLFENNNYGAEFPWCQYAATITLTGADDFKNAGNQAIINLVQARMQIADINLRQTMGADLQGDGTGNSSKAILGLKAAIDDGTNITTYGNISRTTFPSWKSQYSANGGVGRALTLSLMNTVYENTSKDNDRPNLIITTHGLHAKYVGLLQAGQRFGDAQMASAGFQNVFYQQRPVIVDEQIPTTPTESMYLLNTNYLTLYVANGREFRYVPFQQLPQQDAAIAKILFAGQLVCSSPRMQARVVDCDSTL